MKSYLQNNCLGSMFLLILLIWYPLWTPHLSAQGIHTDTLQYFDDDHLNDEIMSHTDNVRNWGIFFSIDSSYSNVEIQSIEFLFSSQMLEASPDPLPLDVHAYIYEALNDSAPGPAILDTLSMVLTDPTYDLFPHWVSMHVNDFPSISNIPNQFWISSIELWLTANESYTHSGHSRANIGEEYWVDINDQAVRVIFTHSNVGIKTDRIDLPTRINIINAYPNPFINSIQFDYINQSNSQVEIKIFNIEGGLVDVLVNEERGYGRQTVHWNTVGAKNILNSSGVYFVQFLVENEAGISSNSKKIMLLK